MIAAIAAAPAQAVSNYPPAFFAAAQPNTALDMVLLLPGFVFDRGDAVRGFGGGAGNVLIDGARPASKTDSLDEVLKRIPVKSVARIEVIRGGAPGVDMQGKTVLANVIRRTDGGATVTAAAALDRADGRFGGTIRAQGAWRVGTMEINGSLLASRGFDDGAGDGPRVRADPTGAVLFTTAEKTDGTGYSYKATGGLETPSGGGRLHIDSSLQLNPYTLTTYDRHLASPIREYEIYKQDQDTAELGARYDRTVGTQASFEGYLLQQFGLATQSDDYATQGLTEDFEERKSTSESIARATLTWNPIKALSLQSGAEGDFNWLLAHTRFLENAAPVVLPAADVRVTEARGEAFETATWQARRTVTLEAGLRLEASQIAATGDAVLAKTLIYPKPRLVVTWSPDAMDQFRLRGEREVSQLNFDDFTGSTNGGLATGMVHAGNPNLNPQTDWVVEAAYDRKFWTAGDATFTWRRYFISDVIDRIPVYDPAGTFDAAGNIGAGSKQEVAFGLSLPTDKLGIARGLLTGQATWRASRVTDPTTGAPRPISSLHPFDGELHFTQGLPRWKATWGFDVLSQWQEVAYRFDEIDIDKLKTYVDFFAEYKPQPDLSIRFELDNATARGFEHIRYIWNASRGSSPLLYSDVRDLHFGQLLHLRVLKTFG
ncbi:MAG: TonB-dependent receptor plug domain-containing protein [Caulobacteraceae bacterium]